MASIDPQPLHVVSEHEVASMANLNLLQQQGFSVPNLFAQSLMPMGPSMTQNVQPLPNANPAASFYLPTGPGMPLSVGASKKVAAPVPMLPAMANLEDLPSSLLRQQQEQQILLSNYLTGNKIKGLKRPHSSIGMLTPGTLLGYDNLAAAAGITRIQTNPVKKTRNGRRVCLVDGCIRFAQGKTKRCISHGGGKRCGQSGCPKSAYGSTKFCIAHGGGERCEVKGCTKSSQGSTKRCKAHGGGRRCKIKNCPKSAQGSMFCKAHGGGKRCLVVGCTKQARGRSGCCILHSRLVKPLY